MGPRGGVTCVISVVGWAREWVTGLMRTLAV